MRGGARKHDRAPRAGRTDGAGIGDGRGACDLHAVNTGLYGSGVDEGAATAGFDGRSTDRGDRAVVGEGQYRGGARIDAVVPAGDDARRIVGDGRGTTLHKHAGRESGRSVRVNLAAVDDGPRRALANRDGIAGPGGGNDAALVVGDGAAEPHRDGFDRAGDGAVVVKCAGATRGRQCKRLVTECHRGQRAVDGGAGRVGERAALIQLDGVAAVHPPVIGNGPCLRGGADATRDGDTRPDPGRGAHIGIEVDTGGVAGDLHIGRVGDRRSDQKKRRTRQKGLSPGRQ